MHAYSHSHSHTHRVKSTYDSFKKKCAGGGVNTSSRGEKKRSVSDGSDIKLLLKYRSGLLIKASF